MNLAHVLLLDGWQDMLPAGLRDFLSNGGIWAVYAAAAVIALLAAAWLLKKIKSLFRGGPRPVFASDHDLDQDLAQCPLSAAPPGDRVLTIYHQPVRVRMVVLAPVRRDVEIDTATIDQLLDRVVPGLGEIVRWDRPRIRVWPAQLSHQAFATTFHRRMHKPEPDGKPSRWVLVAGKAQIGKQSLLLGMGLWADEKNAMGHVTLGPSQWMDALRLRPTGD
jgi:hypothetical protein